MSLHQPCKEPVRREDPYFPKILGPSASLQAALCVSLFSQLFAQISKSPPDVNEWKQFYASACQVQFAVLLIMMGEHLECVDGLIEEEEDRGVFFGSGNGERVQE